MLLSEDDLMVLRRDSTKRVAELLQIDPNDADLDTLFGEIKRRDGEAHNLLSQFLHAWSNWYTFHASVAATGASGRLTPQQNQELTDLVRDRNNARESLVKKTKQLALRHITIRVKPDIARPGRELELIAKIRRDLYSYPFTPW